MRKPTIYFLFLLLIAFGCKEQNDNPAPRNTVTISLGELQKQMAGPNYAIEAGQGVDSSVQALVVGTLAVTSRQLPWTHDLIKSGVLANVFGTDLRNSENYFTIFHLPISEDKVVIELPPENSKNFQIIAVGLRTKPSTVREIGVGDHAGSAVYFGLSDDFYRTNEVANGSLHIHMKRGCLVTPTPDGCAIFGATLAADPKVTASVEILGVKLNGEDYTSYAATFPMVITTAAEATAAVGYLKAVRDEIVATNAQVQNLSVITSHKNSVVESESCQGLVGQKDPYNTLHKAYCEMQEYKVSY